MAKNVIDTAEIYFSNPPAGPNAFVFPNKKRLRLVITPNGGVKTCEPEQNSVYSKIRPSDQSDLDTQNRRGKEPPRKMFSVCAVRIPMRKCTGNR